MVATHSGWRQRLVRPLILVALALGLWATTSHAQAPLVPAPKPAAGVKAEPAPLNPQTVVDPLSTAKEAKITADRAAMGTVGRNFLILLAGAIICFGVGSYLSSALRMPDHTWRFGIVLFSVVGSILLCYLGWPPKLGIDLSGGVNLIYDVDQAQKAIRGATTKDTMDKMVGAISRRVNPSGLKEIVVRRYGVEQLEIIIPNATPEELERIKSIISNSGSLEFRITADRTDDPDIIARALDDKATRITEQLPDGTERLVAKWVPVDPKRAQQYMSSTYISRPGKKGRIELLVVGDDWNVTGKYLRMAKADTDQYGMPCVKFEFDRHGAKQFGGLTSTHLPDPVTARKRQLAIILDGQLYSAPSINSTITDSGEITGEFTRAETEDLASVLNAGSLPVALQKEPSSQIITGPTLGADTIQKGEYAMTVSTVVVVLFMLVYYRFAGIVANIALILNILLTVAFMILFKAAFTLSGLAGLALTVGMAVDANVLIYERMREEMAKGVAIRMTIRNGFDRAMSTIIDSNVTTLIAAVVLYVIGTDQVKGFAITLTLGIVMNLFTAITVTRLIFDVAEKTRSIKKLRMMKLLDIHNIDFIGKARWCVVGSILLITAGLIAAAARGKGLFDIDFTGGVAVEALFTQPQNIADLRHQLDIPELPDSTVRALEYSGESKGTRFMIDTSNAEIVDVERTLAKLFAGKLAYNGLAHGPLDKITATDAVRKDDLESAPEPTAGARRDLPSSSLLALAQDAAPPGAPAAATDAAPAATTKKPVEDAAPKPASDNAAAPSAEAKSGAPATRPVATSTAKPADPAGAEKKPEADAGKPAPAIKPAPGIDPDTLVGGTKTELTFDQPVSHNGAVALLAAAFKPEGGAAQIPFTVENPSYNPGSTKPFKTWTLKAGAAPDPTAKLLKQVQQKLAAQPFFPSSNKVGGVVADNTKWQAFYAIVASLLLIMLYVWFRFTQVVFGIACIVATIHDVLVALGGIALSYYLVNWLGPVAGYLEIEPFKINLPIVAAFLTLIGYSLNDTIVIFDRVREIRGKSTNLTGDLINLCVNQTMSRTILTSLTVLFVVVILYIMGGQAIHGFAFAMVMGTISGTYSTIYIASPMVIWLAGTEKKTSKGVKPTAAEAAHAV